jgi:hypothetical protein
MLRITNRKRKLKKHYFRRLQFKNAVRTREGVCRCGNTAPSETKSWCIFCGGALGRQAIIDAGEIVHKRLQRKLDRKLTKLQS